MSDQNVEQKSDLEQRKRKDFFKVKRKAKSPLNDTNNGDYNNRDKSVTNVSSRKSGVKGKTVSCVAGKGS